MNQAKSRLGEWTYTLVTTLVAVVIVGAIVVSGSYLMSAHRSLQPEGRNQLVRDDAQIKKPSSRTRNDRAKRRDLARPSRPPSVIVHGEGENSALGEPATPAALTDDSPVRPTPEAGPTERDRPVKEKKTPALVERTPAERKQAERRWQKTVEALHLKGLHAQGADAKAKRARAEAELDAIDDPAAAPAIWRSFTGMHAHHLLAAQMLARIDSAETSRMLTFLSVFSDDQKARFTAKNALRTRALSDYGEPLISVIRAPLAHRRDSMDIPGAGRAAVLLVESERACYQFIYPPASRPQATAGPANVYGPGKPYLTPAERAQARMINQQLAQEARASIAFQIQAVIEQVELQNAQIKEQTDRTLGILREISGTSYGPDREEWRRWLAGRLDTSYAPLPKVQKQVISQVVPHLYEPAFLDVPAPS
jgi:hypothetical protein